MSDSVKVTIAQALGLGRGMLTLRTRKGSKVLWAYWRDAQGNQRFRSTHQVDKALAMRAAAMMVLADSEALDPLSEDKPRTDATITEVVAWYREFALSPSQSLRDKRPKPKTADNYVVRTLRLAKLSGATTVGDLQAQAGALNACKLKVSEAAYTSIVRAAGAGLFSQCFLGWLSRNKRVDLKNPLLGNVPPVRRVPPFYAWDSKQLSSLKEKARSELKPKLAAEYLIFLLCLGAGLRRNEATYLKWEDVTDLGVSVRWRSDHGLKSATSARVIPMAASLREELLAFRRDAADVDYVIEDRAVTGRTAPKHGAPMMRAERACRRLMRWLRKNGVNNANPLHHLRRLCGSSWEQQFGLRQASYWLGHSDVSVTARHYVGLRAEAVAGW